MRSFSLSIFAATVLMMSNLALAADHLELHVSDHLQLNVVEGVVKTDKTMLGHYGHPPDECEEDEIAVQIQGIPGAICTPKCSDFMPCPKDVPDGVTAQPTCALKDQSGNEYCVLLCKPGDLRGANECGDATCQPIQGLGICTFDA